MTFDPAFAAIGVELKKGHQFCPYSDHDDSNASFRIHGNRWICTCGHGDVLDALQRYYGISFVEAKAMYGGNDLARPTPPKTHHKPASAPIPRNAYALQLWGAANRD